MKGNTYTINVFGTANVCPSAQQTHDSYVSFSGTTANCKAEVSANRASGKIDLTMILWQGDTQLKSWSTSGTGSVSLSKTYSVEKGKTYTLTVDATINGTEMERQSVTKKS